MEEVWKDIALSNLPANLPSHPRTLHHTAAFHDFLSRAFSDRNPHQSPDHPAPSPTLSSSSGNHSNINPSRPRKRCDVYHPSASAIADGGAERRWKKMIKNRESAARSRARKQAYTNELEMEVAHLVQENAALQREQQQLKMAIAAQATAKGKLQRTLSSPF